jgi:hypothetical protein
MEQWSGNFWSSMYSLMGFSMVKGKIQVHLSTDQTIKNYDAPFTLTYGGSYRPGYVFNGKIKVDDSMFSARLDGLQLITFQIMRQTENIIEGEYSSEMPLDKGSFVIYRDNAYNNSCSLM